MAKKFIKMHGLGNDFAIFDGRSERLDISPSQIRVLANRRTGIGFDQMLIMEPPTSAGTDIFLRIFNADGGEVGACGNATRGIAKILMSELKKSEVTLETEAARLKAYMAGNKVTVDMGPACLDWKDIPLSREENTLSLPVIEGGLKHPVAVNIGNPHAVFFVDNAAKVALETIGSKIEHHPLFPERANVEVAQVLSPSTIRMRVWERGAGVTQACGTGACAVAVAGVRRGLTQRKATIVLDGGELDIEWRESDGHVLMTGDVVEVYRGEIAL
ncbi:MAG: diaminopimelate epimerase [Proteobacteria bacterium]|nr:diaminopimelate epimerase [Pseudomonadota bacterium]